ncbi:multisubunit potassium/proton antiporter PhaG subunit [Rhizobium subbaraonis]|uniref:Multisubunit potassium/proton antiporter PhaG subunit n=1 Tax=Rhizobium subbaraonis TaxID=908946 RepID=A0A285TZB0_9HYPH|nr:monovalent cation/H(+) antiporter subunit G [Rhizobium subbaraonis]SOC34787.1 multisubunit potassium/proton antiporter PhaG subunit [Rhizobium subbaraonis]
MNEAATLPFWAEIVVSAFVLLGASLALIGTIGLARLPTFFERLHAPTLGTSWGTGAMVIASMIFFTVTSGRPVFHEILIGIFVTVTTPVTLMLLAQSALHRERAEGNPDVPASVSRTPAPDSDPNEA